MNYVLLIILLNLVVFFRTLTKYEWVSDDLIKIAPNQPAKPIPKSWWTLFWQHLHGELYVHPDLCKAQNILIHTINCLLIWWVFGHNNISFIASCLFAVNPMNCQGGSMWNSGKPYSITTMFALLMFAMPLISPFWYYLCSFFSGNALLAPLFFTEVPFYQIYAILPFVMGLLLKKVIITKMDTKVETFNNEMSQFYPRKLIAAVKCYGYYFRQCLVPWNLGLYHSFIWGLGVNKSYNKKIYSINKDFWAGLLILIGSILFMYFDKSGAKLGIYWFMINIFIWLNLCTIMQQISERYVYLANCGLMYFVAVLVASHPVAVAVVFTFYLTRLWWYMPSYLNDYWHMLYNICEDKPAHYPWCELAMKYFVDNNYTAAFTMWMEALHRSPKDFKPLFNVSTMLLVMGRVDEARKYLKEAEENMYDGVSDTWVKEFITHNYALMDKVKKEGRIRVDQIKVIK